MVDREGKIAMYFAPDPRHRYPDLEGMRRDEQHFRTLSIAGHPAFLIDEHNPGGSRNCRIGVSVPSGGAIQFEYARRGPGDESDVCPEAVDIVTVIAERVR
ncbi:hypothetical protein [Nocardia asiatica]|uniref:hypothetical protein n=1 Tax=Nocardia asiatica TaxID=209252 RepID=UPI003EE279B0